VRQPTLPQCEPAYPDLCLPVNPGHAINCDSPEVQGAARFRALPQDPFGLDRDGNGIACEDNPRVMGASVTNTAAPGPGGPSSGAGSLATTGVTVGPLVALSMILVLIGSRFRRRSDELAVNAMRAEAAARVETRDLIARSRRGW
jgi:hypothetical protein